MKKAFIALRALVYMSGFVLLWGWIALWTRRFDVALGVTVPGWTLPGGGILVFAGAALALLSAGTFVVRGEGTPAPFDAPVQFVAVGPYRYVRNPMYVGALAMIAGFGFLLHSFSILLLTLVVFCIAHVFVLIYEEPALKREFGATYEEYLRTVPRWIPAVPGAKAKQ